MTTDPTDHMECLVCGATPIRAADLAGHMTAKHPDVDQFGWRLSIDPSHPVASTLDDMRRDEIRRLRARLAAAEERADAHVSQRRKAETRLVAAHDVIRRLLSGQEISQTVRGLEWWGGAPGSDTPTAVTPEESAVLDAVAGPNDTEENRDGDHDG